MLAQITADAIIADKAYDSDAIVEMAQAAGAAAVIPPKKNRKHKRDYSKSLYRERNVERIGREILLPTQNNGGGLRPATRKHF